MPRKYFKKHFQFRGIGLYLKKIGVKNNKKPAK
jgi:hypothetical protein